LHSWSPFFPASAASVVAASTGNICEVISATRFAALKDERQAVVKGRVRWNSHPQYISLGASEASALKDVAAFALRSRFCAALRAVVGKTSRALATRNFPPLVSAFARGVAAAVVCLARVRH